MSHALEPRRCQFCNSKFQPVAMKQMYCSKRCANAMRRREARLAELEEREEDMDNRPRHYRTRQGGELRSEEPKRASRLTALDRKALEIWPKFEDPDYYRRTPSPWIGSAMLSIVQGRSFSVGKVDRS